MCVLTKRPPPPAIFDEDIFFICTIWTSKNLLSSQILAIPTTSYVWIDVSCFSCTRCMYEPANVHVPYESQTTSWIGNLIRKIFCFATELIYGNVECPQRSRQLRNISSNKLWASKMTMRFSGLPCVEAVVYGCRCWKGTKYSYRSNVKLHWRGLEGVLLKVY